MPAGGRRPGSGRKKGSLNKVTSDLMSLAQPYSARAVEVLVHLMEHSKSDTARVMAADKLLDRGHGKPTQALNVKAQVSLSDEFEAYIRSLNAGAAA
jgi:hypothetical protein